MPINILEYQLIFKLFSSYFIAQINNHLAVHKPILKIIIYIICLFLIILVYIIIFLAIYQLNIFEPLL